MAQAGENQTWKVRQVPPRKLLSALAWPMLPEHPDQTEVGSQPEKQLT